MTHTQKGRKRANAIGARSSCCINLVCNGYHGSHAIRRYVQCCAQVVIDHDYRPQGTKGRVSMGYPGMSKQPVAHVGKWAHLSLPLGLV